MAFVCVVVSNFAEHSHVFVTFVCIRPLAQDALASYNGIAMTRNRATKPNRVESLHFISDIFVIEPLSNSVVVSNIFYFHPYLGK